MTALPPIVFFDPSAKHVELHLTYRSASEVDAVLLYAKKIHDDDKDEMKYDDVKAAHAVNLLGLGRGGANTDVTDAASSVVYDDDAAPVVIYDGAVGAIKQHNGEFKLPSRFVRLLGTKRQFTIKGTWQKVAKKVQDLMVVHTLGHWSHWPVLEKIELLVPSKMKAPLRAVDVPGFGDESLDPFRQSIVDEQLKKPASTLCLVLKADMRLEDTAEPAFKRLDKLGTVDNLLAVGVPVDNLLALPTQRRVGKLMTVTAVDWAVKEIVEGLDSAQAKECIEEEHANLVKSSVDWLGGKLFSAAKTKMYGNEMIVQTEVQQINARVKLAIENAVQPCAIDVRSTLTDYDVDKKIKLHIKDFVQQLLDNNEVNQRRLQEALLNELISQCLLPLYGMMNQICQLSELVGKGNDARLPSLDERSLLTGVSSSIENHLSTPENTREANRLMSNVLAPKEKECTYPGIEERWLMMKRYSKPHSHKLSADLKSSKPEETLLPELMIKPLALDTMFPLQEELRKMLLKMTETPANEVSKFVQEIMDQRLGVNIKAAPELEGVLKSAWFIASTGLRDGVRQIIDYFRKLHEVRICSLRDTLPKILHDVLVEEELDMLVGHKKFRCNKKKCEELARRTIGSDGVARTVTRRLRDHVKFEIFAKIGPAFKQRFETLVKYSTGVIKNALNGNVKELEQLNGFAVARKTARETAGIIKAVYESQVAPGGFEHLKREGKLNDIISFAKVPIGLFNGSGAGKDFAQLSGAVVEADDEVDSVGGSGAGTGSAQLSGVNVEADDEWHCPNCFVSASDTDMARTGKFTLMPVCTFDPECFCEKLDRDETYCRLCVLYFGKKHKMRTISNETARRYQQNKRRLGTQAAPQAGKKRCLAQPQAPVSPSQMKNLEEI
mmetsp:Transcript_21612/g.36918  ORF Transcript_21612/g.36918 Transcript_21612/m.36918 type:complete len:894 (+) Transcript_21612:2-2683(+)